MIRNIEKHMRESNRKYFLLETLEFVKFFEKNWLLIVITKQHFIFAVRFLGVFCKYF